jgi:hypothetical protein
MRTRPSKSLAPTGRTLHLVDLDNIVQGPCHPERVVPMLDQLLAVGDYHVGDHVVIGAERVLATAVAFDLPAGSRLLVACGADGADRRLLEAADESFVATHYDRVVIGSGDHAFAPLARALCLRDVQVDVVAHLASLSRALRRAAQVVRLLELPVGHVA